MTQNKNITGHLAALVTILIWGSTFISTKILLTDFAPIEILFYRFVIGLLALLVVYPHRLKVREKKHELTFAAAGLCGVTLYYLLENIALTFTTASNVGVIVSIIPFFTALFAYFFLHDEKPRPTFFMGLAVSVVGICLISFNGNAVLKLNPLGDLLAVLASVVWAGYAVLSRKISSYGYNTIQTTRRIFTYGILFMLPILFRFEAGIQQLAKPVNLFNILFLGLGASALCFVTWNTAVKLLGAVQTSVYIYMVPVITVIVSILVLHETLTWMSVLGMAFSLTGLFISEYRGKGSKKQCKQQIENV